MHIITTLYQHHFILQYNSTIHFFYTHFLFFLIYTYVYIIMIHYFFFFAYMCDSTYICNYLQVYKKIHKEQKISDYLLVNLTWDHPYLSCMIFTVTNAFVAVEDKTWCTFQMSDDDRMSLTTAVSDDDDGESVINSPYRGGKQTGTAAASFNCTGAVRKAGYIVCTCSIKIMSLEGLYINISRIMLGKIWRLDGQRTIF